MTQQSAAFKKVSGQTLKVSCCEKRVTKKTNIKHQTSQLSSTGHFIKTAAESGSGKVQFIVFPRARSDQNNAFQNHREPKKKSCYWAQKVSLFNIQHCEQSELHIFSKRGFLRFFKFRAKNQRQMCNLQFYSFLDGARPCQWFSNSVMSFTQSLKLKCDFLTAKNQGFPMQKSCKIIFQERRKVISYHRSVAFV